MSTFGHLSTGGAVEGIGDYGHKEKIFSIAIGTSDGTPFPDSASSSIYSYTNDIELLTRLLNYAYPQLDRFLTKDAQGFNYALIPMSLKQVADQITFFIDYSLPLATTRIGASTEDDLHFFKYDNPTFYHREQNPSGSIRILVSKKALQIIDLWEVYALAKRTNAGRDIPSPLMVCQKHKAIATIVQMLKIQYPQQLQKKSNRGFAKVNPCFEIDFSLSRKPPKCVTLKS